MPGREGNLSCPGVLKKTGMEKITIKIGGKEYPCRQTMGALLRFKRETGKEITETDGSLSEMCVFLWCCVASACKADGVEFGMSLEDFADVLSPEELGAWAEALSARGKSKGAGEKKRQPRA